MNALVPQRQLGLSRADSRKLSLFTATVGKDLRGAEIDEAIELCEIYGANPFVKDVYFFVFDADKSTRNVVPVLSIGMYRKLAYRSGNYRPDERPARFTYDTEKKSAANPHGLVDCEVSVFIHSHGSWFPVTERIKWEERAPIKEKWENNQPSGKFYLDPKKKNWATMPETMMAKCVETAAIRKAFPEQTAGSYGEGELDQAETINLSATEIISQNEERARFEAIGGANALTVDWCNSEPLERIPVGQFADRILAYLRDNDPMTISVFQERNKETLKEYWAKDKSGALELKKAFEAAYSREAAE